MAANSSRGASPRKQVHGVGEGAAAGELEGVEGAVGLKHLGELEAFVVFEAAGDAVVHVDLGGDGQLVARRGPHRLHGLAGEPGPVVEGAAPGVGALVEVGAQEGAEQVVVAEVDLDGVEAAVGGQAGRPGVVVGDAGDVGVRDGADDPNGQRVEPPGRRDRGGLVGPGVGHRPGVSDLGAGGGALVVDGVGELAKPGHGVGAQPDALGVGAALGSHGQIGHRGHPRPADSHRPVVVDELRRDQRLRHDSLEGGGLDDPVAQGHRPKPGGCERVDGRHLSESGMCRNECPRQESNLRTRFRKPMLYPLSYEGRACAYCCAGSQRNHFPIPLTALGGVTAAGRATASAHAQPGSGAWAGYGPLGAPTRLSGSPAPGWPRGSCSTRSLPATSTTACMP